MFHVKQIDLGDIKERSRHTCEFRYDGDGKPQLKNGKPHLTSSCGCSTPTWDEETKTVQVVYVSEKLADQVRSLRGYSMVNKTITCFFLEHKQLKSYQLRIKAKVNGNI